MRALQNVMLYLCLNQLIQVPSRAPASTATTKTLPISNEGLAVALYSCTFAIIFVVLSYATDVIGNDLTFVPLCPTYIINGEYICEINMYVGRILIHVLTV